MAFTLAAVAEIVSIGKDLYEFIDKVSSGSRGDPLQPIVNKLDSIRSDIAQLGQTLLQAMDEQMDAILDEFHITQLSRIPGAHAAIAAYLRIHPTLPKPPVENDINYALARTTTSDVVQYFRDRLELVFMGGFVYAMNMRVEFITGLNQCWFRPENGYIDEIRRAVNQLNGYISRVKRDIDASVRVRTKENVEFEEGPNGKPIRVVVSVTYSVTGVNRSKTVAPHDRAAGRSAAKSVRDSRSAALQAEIMGYYDQIAAKWNGLIQNFASAAVQRALLPRARATPLLVESGRLAISNLQVAEPQDNGNLREAVASSEDKPPTYVVPLRDLLLNVLNSLEFERRQDSALRSNDPRVVDMWFRKAYHREPTTDESATLVNVMKFFGHKSFFSCLCYSREYEQRYGKGLPNLEEKELEVVSGRRSFTRPVIQESAMEVPANIELKIGETYMLSLPGLGAAGYPWTYEIDGYRTLIDVSATRAEHQQPRHESEVPLVSSGSDEVFILQALAVGHLSIRFVRRRPWEKNQPPLKEHIVNIEIKA